MEKDHIQKHLLGICIPTYNRSQYLKGLLANISSELEKYGNSDDVQIIIVDGHSDDDTEEIVNAFRMGSKLIYFRRQVRVGVDKDILKSVELSDAKYCWLFSDDDQFTDGAINYLLEILRKEKQLSGCFCNRVTFDFKLEKQIAEVRQWPGKVFTGNRLFLKKSDCIKNIGMDFGFISSQIVNRSMWQKAVGYEDYGDLYKSYYILVHIMFKMMDDNCRWLYIHRPMLMQRTGNDTLLKNEGVIKRQKVEHENFEIILNLHYDQSTVEHHVFFKKMVARLPRAIANLKSQNISYATQYYLFKLLYKKYRRYGRFWHTAVPIFFMPNIFLFYVKKFYFKYRV